MILITGSTGFLGTHVSALLPQATRIMGRADGVDLRNPDHLPVLLSEPWSTPPRVVIHLAYPGTNGIGTMLETGADLVHDLLQIDLNVIDACAKAGVKKLICVGSVCGYPEQVTFPADETQLWSGYPEAVNAPYGIAKRMQLELLKVYRRQYGLNGVHLILGNLYGPGDRSGHVIPSIIRKVLAAKAAEAPVVDVWGDGSATREFLYVEDAARAIVAAVDADVGPDPINVCSGDEIAIRTVAMQTMAVCQYPGRIQWDHTKPNGQPRRWFSNAKATERLGWHPQMSFSEGLRRTIAWMEDNTDARH